MNHITITWRVLLKTPALSNPQWSSFGTQQQITALLSFVMPLNHALLYLAPNNCLPPLSETGKHGTVSQHSSMALLHIAQKNRFLVRMEAKSALGIWWLQFLEEAGITYRATLIDANRRPFALPHRIQWERNYWDSNLFAKAHTGFHFLKVVECRKGTDHRMLVPVPAKQARHTGPPSYPQRHRPKTLVEGVMPEIAIPGPALAYASE